MPLLSRRNMLQSANEAFGIGTLQFQDAIVCHRELLAIKKLADEYERDPNHDVFTLQDLRNREKILTDAFNMMLQEQTRLRIERMAQQRRAALRQTAQVQRVQPQTAQPQQAAAPYVRVPYKKNTSYNYESRLSSRDWERTSRMSLPERMQMFTTAYQYRNSTHALVSRIFSKVTGVAIPGDSGGHGGHHGGDHGNHHANDHGGDHGTHAAPAAAGGHH